MKTKFIFKRVLTLVLAVMMLVTAMPVGVLAEPVGAGNQNDSKFEIKYDDGSIVRKEDYINETKNLPVVPKKTENATGLVAKPAMPKLYTVHSDFKVRRGDDLVVSYQPYMATAGDDAYEYTDNKGVKQKVLSDEEKDKIKTLVKFPVLDGYTSATPEGKAEIKYDFIKKRALAHKNLVGDEYKGHFDYIYTPKNSSVKVKHVFQDINDFNKYGKKPGDTEDRISTQYGLTGTSLTIQPLPDFATKGYVPESMNISTQVPESPEDFIVEYRYNLAHYTVNYDTGEDGSPLPTRTLFYNQVIPKLNDLTTKDGAEFLGWKPSIELEGTINGFKKTFKVNEIITDNEGNAIVDLHNLIYEKDANGNLVYEDLIDPATGKPKKDPVTRENIKSTKVRTKNSSDTISLIMPAEKLTFTAVWKDKERADYAVQFWAEKADHTDNASLLEKYDFIGTRVYKDQPVKVKNKEGKWVGFSPDLDNVPVDKIVFPDLDQARLAKIWAGARFNRGNDLYLNKFYVYNKDLTHDQNKDPANVNLVKSVDSTGKTVYNIYYDRQVYDLYFTKSNAQPEKNTFYPEIWDYDPAQEKSVMIGGPGKPYHYKARFNQLMLGWPNDAMQTKGFSKGMQSFGWGPNYNTPNWPGYLDTPPYRLNADEFLDMPNYIRWGGYTKKIDKGDGTSINLEWFDFTTLSFGINQAENSMPHHMDFWMDGFKDGETIIRYDLYRFKADTDSESYRPKYPKVQGFTGKRANEPAEFLDEGGIDDKNGEREEVTKFPAKTYTVLGEELPLGKMKFIKAFFSNVDEFGDPLTDEDGEPLVKPFEKNGYLKFKYTRNKYPLRFNYDPSITRDDSYFNGTNSLDTFYEFPLKALSPKLVDDSTPQADREYFKENPANFLDNPENLQKLGLTDLVFTDIKDRKLKVKRPDNLSDDMVFKGWALDPAGFKLISKNASEKMPNHAVNIYAKWGDPDTRLGITFDANGGTLPNIDPEKLTQKQRTIIEGDVGNEKEVTYPIKVSSDSNKAVFTVIQKQKLVEPDRPTRDGYNFLGWEVLRYKKDATTGEYTNDFDTSFKDDYGVPELYSFGNEVAGPLYLKAIWVKNDLVDVKSYHHFLDENYKETDQDVQTLRGRRVGSYLAAVGSRQNAERFLVPKTEWDKLEKGTTDIQGSMLYKDYKTLDPDNPRVNSYNQQIRVEPEKIQDPDDPNKLIANPDAKLNQFHFYYRPFRHREYKVNYLDERGREAVEKFIEDSKKAFKDIKDSKILDDIGKIDAYKKLLEKNRTKFEAIREKYAIIKQETIKNGKRHYDARNYRPIDGWVLDDKPQKQLFFDIDEDSSAFFGINETGLDEIYFYYKDVRVIETKKDDPVPDGYVRVTYKADKGGAFTDKDGNSKTELYYDVIKGLKSDLLPEPKELEEGKAKEEGKYYITPETGKKFIKWDEKPLLNKNTIVDNDTKDFYVFTAKFEWSGLSASGLVRTEAFKDDKADGTKDWSNKFAPTIDELKAQLVWMEKGEKKDLPAGTVIKLFDEAGNELTTDEQVYELVNEKKAADKDELVRTVNVKAKVTFKDGKEPQELTIPITVYKNVYEALTGTEKPLFLSEAEKKEAKDGGLKDVTGDYAKVIVAPTGDMNAKDNKVYYVNKNAWVVIPEVKPDGSSTFINWTADIIKQNDDGKASGNFDFAKRHKFTEETVIKPVGAGDVVEQTDPNKKPDVPKSYVEVIVKTTDKATDETAFEKTFWVNPTKEVTIPVSKPNGKTIASSATNPQQIAWMFEKWTDDKGLGSWTDTIKAQFTAAETIITANYTEAKNIIPYDPEEPITRPDDTYVRVKFDADKGLTLTEQKAYYVKKNSGVKLLDLIHPNYEESTGYKFDKWDKGDTTVIGDRDITVTAQANKLDNVIEDDGNPNTKPTGYVDVEFKTEDAAKGSLVGVTKFFVKPNEYVMINPPTPTPKTGFEFGAWDKDATIPTEYKDPVTTITASFNELDAVSLEPKPGYVKVEFTIEGNNGSIETGQTSVYYVDPNRAVTLNPPTTKANIGYEFEKWSEDTTTTAKKYTTPTTVKGNFKKLEDIIPSKDNTGNPNAQPEGYVTVTFTKGDHGSSIEGETVYYVNPTANKTLADITPKPTVIPDTGYAVNGWDKADDFKITQDTTVNAKYDNFGDVIPDDGNPNTKPDGYIKVIFDTTDKGTIKGSNNKTQKIVFVKPNTAVALKGYEPEVQANARYDFSSWDVDLTLPTVYNSPKTITAQYNNLGDISTTEVTDFVKVEFKTDDTKGVLVGNTELWVRPGVDLTLPAPIVTAEPGHTFTKWDKTLSVKFNASDPTYVITAEYDDAKNIIPEIDANGQTNAKPKGYVTVTFRADDNGKLEGDKKEDKKEIVYFVNPEAGIMIVDTVTDNTKQIAVPKTKPDTNYVFDKWYEDIEKTDPIKTDQEYVARFNKGKVTLTYDAGGADGTVPIQVIVDHGTKVRLASATGLSKTDATFAGWKLDGDETIYQDGDLITLEKDRTATAQWTPDKDIIEYNPDEPITKPKGYVRVKFEAEDGLSLSNVKYYYVKANKNIILKSLTHPDTKAETGYKFKEWDTSDATKITTDITVKALAKKLDKSIPEKNDDGSKNDKPEGYKEVTFVVKTEDKSNGSIEGNTKFYVNPTEYVTINPPTTKANTGFVFGAWSPDSSIPTVYDKDTTITASFNVFKDVIPKTDESEKPAGYVTVTYELEKLDGKEAGKIVDGEIITYYVKPNTDVTVPQPGTIAYTGYVFKNWDPDTSKNAQYSKDTTIRGSFTKLQDIIPSKDPVTNKDNAKPNGYITVTFDKGDHGKEIKGQTVYYVNPTANITLGDKKIVKPTATPETGYKFTGWDTKDDFEIKDNKTVIAQYEALHDVIVKTADNDSEKPDGYITVTFDTVDSGKGVIGSTIITKKVLFVNPNKAIPLTNYAPEVSTKTGYKFARWDVSIDKAIQYKKDDVIHALYNEPENISTTEVYGYVKVEFKEGKHGSLQGQTKYWIKPGVAVNIPEPTVKPNLGYKFDKWDKSLTVNAQANDPTYEITAGYTQLDDIIPEKNIEGLDKPEGYVTVKFEAKYGTLKGTLVYYVNPNKDILLLGTADSKIDKADIGYTPLGGTWSEKVSETKKYAQDTTITFTYKELDNVIPEKDPNTGKKNEQPNGYVKVTLKPTNKATDETKAEKVYYVNPKANVTITNIPVGKSTTDANGTTEAYTFSGWTVTRGTINSWTGETITGKFIQDTEITAKYSLEWTDIPQAPVAKENVSTPVDVMPKAKDLIKNADELPQGTDFKYEKSPDVQIPGDDIAKVKVTYPNGKTVIVEVPVKVVNSVIPQKGKDKPKNVPSTFVKVTFDPTAKGTLEGTSIYWVDPTKEVTIPVNKPVGKGYNVFNGWKIGNDDYDPKEDKKFTDKNGTTITASYIDSDNIIPFDPNAEPPMARPEGYYKVSFDAQVGLKLRESKAYYVKKDAKDSEGKPLTLKAIKDAGYPAYDAASGYSFENWDKADTTIVGTEDIVVTALAKVTPSEPGNRPSYPEVIYRDKIVEKEKIVEKVVEKTHNIYGEMDKELRYMQGYNGKFRPNDGLTRAEAAQILANALKADGYSYDANYALGYNDVGNKWYTDAIRVVTQAGVFKGYSDGTFRPQGKITRAEWVATLRRFQDLKEATGNTMMLRSGHWATAEVEAAYEAGWLGVYQDGIAKFDADKPITRQEVAYVSNRAFNRVLDKIYLKRSANTLITYKDVSPSMPLYEDILCASNTLLTDGKYYRANTVDNDLNKFNMVTDGIKIDGKKFQFNTGR